MDSAWAVREGFLNKVKSEPGFEEWAGQRKAGMEQGLLVWLIQTLSGCTLLVSDLRSSPL